MFILCDEFCSAPDFLVCDTERVLYWPVNVRIWINKQADHILIAYYSLVFSEGLYRDRNLALKVSRKEYHWIGVANFMTEPKQNIATGWLLNYLTLFNLSSINSILKFKYQVTRASLPSGGQQVKSCHQLAWWPAGWWGHDLPSHSLPPEYLVIYITEILPPAGIMTSRLLRSPPALSQSATWIFRNIQLKSCHQLAWWPAGCSGHHLPSHGLPPEYYNLNILKYSKWERSRLCISQLTFPKGQTGFTVYFCTISG